MSCLFIPRNRRVFSSALFAGNSDQEFEQLLREHDKQLDDADKEKVSAQFCSFHYDNVKQCSIVLWSFTFCVFCTILKSWINSNCSRKSGDRAVLPPRPPPRRLPSSKPPWSGRRSWSWERSVCLWYSESARMWETDGGSPWLLSFFRTLFWVF